MPHSQPPEQDADKHDDGVERKALSVNGRRDELSFDAGDGKIDKRR